MNTRKHGSDSTPWDDTLFSGTERGARRPSGEIGPPPGQPRYEEVLPLGEGGMGKVHEAYDRVLRRRVALKVLREELAGAGPERDAFVREARLTSRLEHPHIVPVHDLILDGKRDYAAFLMKRIEGQTLSEWLAATAAQGLSSERLDRMLDVLLKVCDAVAFAHARNVLHLDLKPENVMLGEHGEVYVMDWGIAVECELDERGALRPLTQASGIRGSLAYMAPEQLEADGAAVDQRTDVHGLGALLYTMLAGRPPYSPRADTDSLLGRLDRGPHAPLAEAEHACKMPPGLVELAEKALSTERSARYASVAELRGCLEAFRRGGGWFACRSFPAGAVIVAEGERADAAYVISEGRCEVRKRQLEGEVVLREMHAGEVFGETALLLAEPRTASVVALEPVRLLVITPEALKRELTNRDWLAALVQALAWRFAEADRERAALRDERSQLRAEVEALREELRVRTP